MHHRSTAGTARHRRELTTRERVRLSLVLLGGLGVVAAVGVFGGTVTMQTEVLSWLVAHRIGLAFAGWAIYATPVAALTVVVAPLRLGFRLAGFVVLLPGLVAMAVMGRPRGMSTAAWEGVMSIGYVHAAQLTAYATLAVFVVWAIHATLVFLHGDDAMYRIRRTAAFGGGTALIVSAVLVAAS